MSRSRFARPALAAAFSIALAAAVSANVRVVAPTGAPYTQIQPAIDASANGDTILVKAGTYSGFAIVARARLHIAADAGATPAIQGLVQVRNCTGYIALSGFTVSGLDLSGQRLALSLANNTGPVRITSCGLFAASGDACVDRTAVRVENSNDVELAACNLQGGGTSGGRALFSIGSSVAMYDSVARGGDNLCQQCGYVGYPGGDGIELGGSFLFASRTMMQGGHGANTGTPPTGTACGDAGHGGAGLVVHGDSQAHVVDSVASGGAGGSTSITGGYCGDQCCSICCTCFSNGAPGQAFLTYPGAVLDQIAGPGRTLTTPSVVREQQSASLEVGGVPGDVVALQIAQQAGFAWRPQFAGVSLVVPPPGLTRWLILGTIGSSGLLNYPLPISDLAPGTLAWTFHLQALHRASNGTSRLGTGRTMLVLDSTL